MKKAVIALLGAMALNSAAADVYIQGGVGATRYDFSGATLDQTGTNWFGSVGYIFDNNLGLEGEYEYTTEADLADGVSSDSQNALNFYGVGRIPLDNADKVNLIAKAGAGYTRQKINGESERTWYPALGLGVEWLMTDSLALVGLVDHKVYDFNDNNDSFSANPTTYKAGLQYRF